MAQKGRRWFWVGQGLSKTGILAIPRIPSVPASSLVLFLGLRGYEAAGLGAGANPSALSDSADSSCYAVKFRCQTRDVRGAICALLKTVKMFRLIRALFP